MKQNIPITGRLACILIAMVFAWGCGDQADTARKPQVVRKKIVVAAKPTAKARKKQMRPAAGKASAPRPKSDLARAKPPRSKAAVAAAAAGKGGAVSQKGLRPRSDIARQPLPSASPGKVAQKSAPRGTEKSDAAALPASASVKPSLTPRSEPSKAKPPTSKAAAKKDSAKKKPTDKAKPAAKGKPDAKKKKPAKKKGQPPVYNPTGRTDPFSPLFQERPAQPRKPTRKRRIPRTPLEKISLSQLKLTAIILAASGNRALVQEASGKGYVIRNGTYIGLDGGKVVNIERGRVVIEEEVEDIVGKLTKRKQELKLAKPVGER